MIYITLHRGGIINNVKHFKMHCELMAWSNCDKKQLKLRYGYNSQELIIVDNASSIKEIQYYSNSVKWNILFFANNFHISCLNLFQIIWHFFPDNSIFLMIYGRGNFMSILNV